VLEAPSLARCALAEHPAVDRLVIAERTGDGPVGLDVPDPALCSVRSGATLKALGLTEQEPSANMAKYTSAVCRPYVWTKTTEQILNTLAAYCERTSDSDTSSGCLCLARRHGTWSSLRDRLSRPPHPVSAPEASQREPLLRDPQWLSPHGQEANYVFQHGPPAATVPRRRWHLRETGRKQSR